MPYDADLRCSYCSFELNMSWFYESVKEMGYEIDFKPYVDEKLPDPSKYPELEEELKEEQTQLTITLFERHIESKAKAYMIYKTFNHKKDETNFDSYNNIWEYLFEQAMEYTKKNTNVTILPEEESE